MEKTLKKSLKLVLSEKIPESDLKNIYSSYDLIGDIAILRLTEEAMKYSEIIAEALMNIHKNVKTVLAQVSPVKGEFRLRKLEFLAGEKKTVTVHKESGCKFLVDVEKCYFSPRLLYERMRIAKQVRDYETVVNMFAGVGCYSIIIAKHSKVGKVYSIDLNPVAVQFMKENVRLNRLYGRVIPIQGDAGEIIKEKLSHVADRVLMPLPEKALEYLPYALLALKKHGVGWIHLYDFEHARKSEKPMEKVKFKVTEKLLSLNEKFEIPFNRIVRTVGPNWYQVVLDIKVKRD
ncbi:class I SAM-dependent methyltransferase family protein [Candidatus Bathyarchaeota archaeon]|nr:class I SAM-dependent methyltransferase family protein [Candidatus Bathyarchaeota archaeon]